MLHIATVHWKNADWIEIQRRFLDRYAGGPFAVYSFVNGIESDYSHLFRFHTTEALECCSGAGYNHGAKLNILVDVIGAHAGDDAIVVFLDGDAFPIADMTAYVQRYLAKYPLLAVRRAEHLGDKQPHPSFAATTVGFWKKIRGDWQPGYTWVNDTGESITDTGGNLLGRLLATNSSWHEVLRTNRTNLHPLWFGVYGGVVYHHGAGFRGKIERIDIDGVNRRHPVRARIKSWQNSSGFIRKNVGHVLNSLYPHGAYNSDIAKARESNKSMMDDVYARLRVDDEFWRDFV